MAICKLKSDTRQENAAKACESINFFHGEGVANADLSGLKAEILVLSSNNPLETPGSAKTII